MRGSGPAIVVLAGAGVAMWLLAGSPDETTPDITSLPDERTQQETGLASVERPQVDAKASAEVRELTRILQEADDATRLEQVREFAYGSVPFDKTLADLLVACLSSPDAELRVAVMQILESWRHGGAVLQEMPYLTLLEDEHPTVRGLTYSILAEGVPLDAALAKRLGKAIEDEETSWAAFAIATAWAKMDPPALEHLRASMAADRVRTRAAAYDALQYLPVQTLRGFTSSLKAGLREDVVGIRKAVLVALAEGDADWGMLREDVVASMQGDVDRGERSMALKVLTAMRSAAGDVIPVLLSLAEDRDEEIAADAVRALGGFPASADVVVPVLADLVASKGSQEAALALSQFGEEGLAAAGRVFSEGSPEAREAALGVFLRQRRVPADLLPEILALVSGDDAHLRTHATQTLGFLEGVASKAVPLITKRLEDEDLDDQDLFAVGRALERMGDEGRTAMRKALGAEDSRTRRQALQALVWGFPQETAFALDAVEPLTRSQDPKESEFAIRAMFKALEHPDGFGKGPEGKPGHPVRVRVEKMLKERIEAKDKRFAFAYSLEQLASD